MEKHLSRIQRILGSSPSVGSNTFIIIRGTVGALIYIAGCVALGVINGTLVLLVLLFGVIVSWMWDQEE